MMRSADETREAIGFMVSMFLAIFAGIFFVIFITIAECIIRALPYACVAALIYVAYRIALLVL